MSIVEKRSDDQREALALRVAELSSVIKQQREEIEEQRAVLENQRKLMRDHEEIIRMQEGQLIERDAQLQAQNADIRALRRQHAADAEALRQTYDAAEAKRRPGSPSKSPSKSPQKLPWTAGSSALRKQLQQTIADKVVLVRALHQLTAEMAQARAEVSQHKAASERSLSTAWRLGQLGQLGLALLEMGDDEVPLPDDASASADDSSLSERAPGPAGARSDRLLEASLRTPITTQVSPTGALLAANLGRSVSHTRHASNDHFIRDYAESEISL